MRIFSLIKPIILILIIILNASCHYNSHKKHNKPNKPIDIYPAIEQGYYESQEKKDSYDIKGFIERARAKQASESFELRAMKFTAYLFDKLVCMNYMNTLFTKDVEARFTNNYSPKFAPDFGKNITGKYDYFWTNRFGNLVLQFGDHKQGIYGCGQVIFSSNKVFNKKDLIDDVDKMVNILNPIAKQLVTDAPLNKLKLKSFFSACEIFYKNNFDTVVLNFQKKLPEFPQISKELIKDYKNTRLETASYINDAMFKGCSGQNVADGLYKKTIQAFVENFIYCTECDFSQSK